MPSTERSFCTEYKPAECKKNADILVTPLSNHDRELHYQDKVIIEEFYTELYDSERSNIIHTNPKEVTDI